MRFHQGSYGEIAAVLDDEELEAADFILLDLGVSTYQLKNPGRGFSLMSEGPLDMRMDPTRGPTARELLERSNLDIVERWLREYGEVKMPGRIARVICERHGQLRTTADLREAVLAALPGRRREPGAIHPATQVFQALRIAVNRELEELERALPSVVDGPPRSRQAATVGRLAAGGRAAIISFHSLEDRRVKQAFDQASRDCICPPRIPVCGCRHRASVKLLHRKPLVAS